MIRVQHFANFAGDSAVTMSDILKNCMGPPNFLGFWGLMDFKQPLKFNYFYFRLLISHLKFMPVGVAHLCMSILTC